MHLLGLRDDLREALRRIRRNPHMSLVAAATMAVGIGASTAIFTIAHTCLMAPPPFRQPDRIVNVHGWSDSRGRQGVSGADLLDYMKERNLFEAGTLAGYGEFSWTGQSLPGFDGAEVLRGYEVTAGYFRVMDQPMAAGRGFLSGEEHVAVISHGLWQRRFAGRGDIIGQTVTLNGTPHVVVGVAGRGFVTYEHYDVVAWVPISPGAQPCSSRQYDCYARLAPGVGLERRVRHGGPEDEYENQLYVPYRQANSDVMFLVVRTLVPPESVVPAIRATLKSLDPNAPAFEIRSLQAAFRRETAMPRLPMALTAGFAGLAALLAALGLFGVIAYWVSQRTRELGIRSAIGARPGELRALVLRQGLGMTAIGLTAGVVASLAVMRYLRSLLYGMSERDPWIYAGAVSLALATAAVACWIPASRAARVDPATALRQEG